MNEASILPLEWIRAQQWCNITGHPLDSVESYIRDHEWAAGVHYKRTGQRTLWINVRAADEWISNLPHVETNSHFQKVSKSAMGRAAQASA